ncbi:endonuclease/exonuclease/phosphatase family protein [Candidatus Poriferisodalis sp.]|uniref:endonuclease/exonuclease/phosphatase family protein n=1 Tax=Candidatus Poriferisodalis sp. TaxID=3101277 RepID=UPI003C6F2432
MRVVTWNLWWRFGDDWQARHSAAAAALEALEPDIVCCQEIWATQDGMDQSAVLAERLGMHVAHQPRFGRRGESFGNAILSRSEILSSEVHTLASEVHTLAVDNQSGHRSAVVARIARGDGEMTVICTHLEHRFHLSEIRQGQVATLCELAAPHHDPAGFPVILAGDFNAVPTSEEIRLLTGERPPPVPELVFSDAWAQAGDGPGHTWSGQNPYLSQAMWPNRRIDYVFVSTPRPVPVGNISAIQLIGTEPIDGVVPSDHYGLAVDLVD